jgi:hypothetical protein
MLSKQKSCCSWAISSLLFFSLILTTALPVFSQSDNSSSNETDETETELMDENTIEQVNQAGTLISLEGGQKLMAEAKTAINAENYNLAETKLKQARRIFNQLSNFYLQLADSFSGIENRIAESQRSQALETAALRDEATYQLALVHRAQNQAELAIPLLIQIIRSQNPTTELGRKSYQQLYEIGFVETPYQSSRN